MNCQTSFTSGKGEIKGSQLSFQSTGKDPHAENKFGFLLRTEN